MSDAEEVKVSLKVMMNKQKSKVLFAESDSDFVDILLSFLTLPLGRTVKVLEKHYGDEAPTIGSLNNLYRSLANLDSSHFVTEGAKQTLLDSASSFEDKYKMLKVDISDSPPAEYFVCSSCANRRLRCDSIYYDSISCYYCEDTMSKEVVEKSCEADGPSDGVFTKHTSSFLISNDLHILPKNARFLTTVGILGITVTDMDNAVSIKVDFGISEIMKLLKASLMSPTPLSDLILNKSTTLMNNSTPVVESRSNHSSRYFSLKVMIQKSTGKLLYAQTNEDFVEFLFNLLSIPLGRVEHLLILSSDNMCFKAINNLYRSTTNLIDAKHFKNGDVKDRLRLPMLLHGCMSSNLIILGSVAEVYYRDRKYSSVKFPKGKGIYLQKSQSYLVKDDLTVVPYCFVTILSSLREQKIPISDVEEVQLKIESKETLSILKASLTSTTVLSDALLSLLPKKQPKREL
ncbi:uncharacterized protein LOC131009368 [Salvia miltiorrhiza]|uniref:uncharacterized protein LOC131009368 n=1 Tax=Salvia miltiorrhiza TaxID=226208 RepID=UPI0025AC133B|nr:uncharacterized protein LOC131009368 [Salvia miltiorrhiza]XP_057792647.1 uncharacterized protein LOC131009368 [Salvia miltiorrhiza]